MCDMVVPVVEVVVMVLLRDDKSKDLCVLVTTRFVVVVVAYSLVSY